MAGVATRQDHMAVAGQVYAALSHARQVRELTDLAVAEALPPDAGPNRLRSARGRSSTAERRSPVMPKDLNGDGY